MFVDPFFASASIPTIWLLLLVTLGVYVLFQTFYNIFLHPLSGVPGPALAKSTPLWHFYHSFVGDECAFVNDLHKAYGPVIRVAPNELDISDGEALAPIYSDKGGFPKAPSYANFHIDGLPTIFSTSDTAYRNSRGKPVTGLFSNASIKAKSADLYMCIENFIQELKESRAKAKGQPVDIQSRSRFLALDVVCTYLFKKQYQPLSDPSGKEISAIPWLDGFLFVGGLFPLPNRLFTFCAMVIEALSPHKEAMKKSAAHVHDFSTSLLHESHDRNRISFQGRLVEEGIPEPEIVAHIKDVIFAGTDSTGMVIGTILWNISKSTEVYSVLRDEISKYKTTKADLQSLPYLRGVVKEGLRLSSTNPTRLLRTVPSTGFTFKNIYIPPGTMVGCASSTLHFNAAVFPSPHSFEPERWAKPSAEMTRDWVPFGTGLRQCIARNLATQELFMVVEKVVESGVLEGAMAVGEKIEIWEWFNAAVKGNKIEIVWDD